MRGSGGGGSPARSRQVAGALAPGNGGNVKGAGLDVGVESWARPVSPRSHEIIFTSFMAHQWRQQWPALQLIGRTIDPSHGGGVVPFDNTSRPGTLPPPSPM